MARGLEAALWTDDAKGLFKSARRRIIETGSTMDAFAMEAALSEYIDCAVLLARRLYPLRMIRKDLELPSSKRIEDRKQSVIVAERFCKRPSTEMDSAEDDDVYVNLSLYDDQDNWGDEP